MALPRGSDWAGFWAEWVCGHGMGPRESEPVPCVMGRAGPGAWRACHADGPWAGRSRGFGAASEMGWWGSVSRWGSLHLWPLPPVPPVRLCLRGGDSCHWQGVFEEHGGSQAVDTIVAVRPVLLTLGLLLGPETGGEGARSAR